MKKILLSLLMVTTLMASALANTIAITVPFPPGGPTDAWARLISKHLNQELNNEYVVKNIPGAGGKIAVETVLRHPADGHNLIIVGSGPILFNKVLSKKINYDYTDFDTLVPMASVPFVLAVSNRLGVNNFKEFIELARKKPLNCAGSSGSGVFIGRYLMQQIKARDVEFIPFRGSADMNIQLAAGNIDCGIDTTLMLPLHQANKLKIIATSTQKQIIPNTALFKSAVPGLVFNTWFGVGVRVNSPGSDQLFQTLRKINQNPEFQASVKNIGLEPVDPVEHGSQWIHQEYLKYDALREKLNIAKE